MQGQAPSPQMIQDIARLEKEIELYSQEKLCYEAQILRVYNLSLSLSLRVCVYLSLVSELLISINKPLVGITSVFWCYILLPQAFSLVVISEVVEYIPQLIAL